MKRRDFILNNIDSGGATRISRVVVCVVRALVVAEELDVGEELQVVRLTKGT